MIAAGEFEIARAELRWLLEGCTDNIAVQELLGEIALEENDIPLARGHFGYAFQIGKKAIEGRLPDGGQTFNVPFKDPASQAFFSAGKGLVHCLLQLDKHDPAQEVVEFLLQCDSSDPLNLRAMLQPSGEMPRLIHEIKPLERPR